MRRHRCSIIIIAAHHWIAFTLQCACRRSIAAPVRRQVAALTRPFCTCCSISSNSSSYRAVLPSTCHKASGRIVSFVTCVCGCIGMHTYMYMYMYSVEAVKEQAVFSDQMVHERAYTTCQWTFCGVCCAGAMNVSDVEASLKSLLMANKRASAETHASLQQHPGTLQPCT